MKKHLSIMFLLAFAILPACEGDDANKPTARADRVASICETACEKKGEDLCEEKSSTKAPGKSCHDRCKAEVEETIADYVPASDSENKQDESVLDACRDALLDMAECGAGLSCSEGEEVDSDGNSVHCVSEGKKLLTKCQFD